MEMNRTRTLECQSSEGEGLPTLWVVVMPVPCGAPSPMGWGQQLLFCSASPAFALADVRTITCHLQVLFLAIFHPLQTQLEISSLAPLLSAPREAVPSGCR